MWLQILGFPSLHQVRQFARTTHIGFREIPDLNLVVYYRNSQAGGHVEGQGGMALPCPRWARHPPYTPASAAGGRLNLPWGGSWKFYDQVRLLPWPLGTELSLQPLPPTSAPEVEGGLKVPPHLTNYKNYSYPSRGLRGSVPGTRDKDQIYFVLYPVTPSQEVGV